LDTYSPDVVIHCAAMANLEACELNPDLANNINAIVPGEIAIACKDRRIKLVHISTDAVFDGNRGDYSEIDIPNPLSIYAKTKRAGEVNVFEQNPNAIIARVNFYGWSQSGHRSLAEFFYNNLKEQNPINGFVDVHFCPLYVTQLIDILVEMIEKNLYGIYHVVSDDQKSKYQFGCAIAEQFEFDKNLINPISVSESNLLAQRSLNLTLSTSKLMADLGHALPSISDGIKLFNYDFKNGYSETLRKYSRKN
jgi:dTDP-4-dehydrorhamnose reductase